MDGWVYYFCGGGERRSQNTAYKCDNRHIYNKQRQTSSLYNTSYVFSYSGTNLPEFKHTLTSKVLKHSKTDHQQKSQAICHRHYSNTTLCKSTLLRAVPTPTSTLPSRRNLLKADHQSPHTISLKKDTGL